MNKNMGTIDRVLRLLVATAIVALYLTGKISGVTFIVLGILALIFVVTSIVSFCPLYWPLKISTIGKK
jgi:hypothetical protein